MLFGRDPERAQLGALLEAAFASRSAALVVRGHPGVGKSALLDYLHERAEGMHVLAAGGVESEAELPFAALQQIFHPALRLLDRIPVPQAAALRSAFGLEAGEPQERFLVFAACLSLLSELAEERPVLCLIDDAHWVDSASAEALQFVARRLRAEGIVIVFAARIGEGRPWEIPGVPCLDLEGLDPDAAAAMLARSAGVDAAPSVRDWLLERTGGNALALVELSSALSPAQLAGREQLPDTLPLTDEIERVFLASVRHLPESTQRLLLVAAADSSCNASTIIRASALHGADANALDPAEEAGLVSVRGSELEFRHPLVRSAIYQGSPLNERRAAHRALAQAMDAESDDDHRIWHLAASAIGPDETIACQLDEAAERIERRGGYEAAARALERAAELSTDQATRGRRLLRAARTAMFTGPNDRAAALAERARPYVEEPILRAELARMLALDKIMRGSRRDAQRVLVDAAHEVQGADPRKALELLVLTILPSPEGSDPDILVEGSDLAATITVAADDESAAFSLALISGVGALARGDTEEGARLLEEPLSWASAADDLRVLVLAAIGGLWIGDERRAGALLNRAISLSRARGALGVLGHALSLRATQLLRVGRFNDAAQAAEEAVHLARELGHDSLVPPALSVLATAAALHGRDDKARELAAQAIDSGSARGLGLTVGSAMWALALVDLGRARWNLALERLDAIAEEDARSGLYSLAVLTAPDRVEASVRAGSERSGQDALSRLESVAGPGAAACLQPILAGCRALLSDGIEANRQFERALAQRMNANPFACARIQLVAGEHLMREGRRADAQAHLREAFKSFEHLQFAPWAERARAALQEDETAGDASLLSRLTSEERQVARLAAQGLSTRQTAAQLYVSPRTIDSLLGSVLKKLDISSPSQLAVLPLGDETALGPPLLERDTELARIDRLISRAVADEGGALLIEGEAGIGKSALLSAARGIARDYGLRVLEARGGELEGEFAYGLVRQLFERELAAADAARRQRLLAGAASLAAPVVAPNTSLRVGDAAPDALALEHGLYWLLSNLADERPVALLIDDLQWADAAALRWLVYAARRLTGMPIALLGTVRLGEKGATDELLDQLRTAQLVETVALDPLGEQAVAGLVTKAFESQASSSFASACHEVTGGNPFFVADLLSTLAAEGAKPTDDWATHVRDIGAPGVSRTVLLRLARLSKDAVALAEAVAILGTGTEIRHAASLAGLSPEAAESAADTLADAYILVRGRPLEFRHPLMRTAVYMDLSPGRRTRDHKRAAQILTEDAAPHERVAGQLLHAETAGDDWVVETLTEAAEAALAAAAPEAAATYLERALAEPPQADQRARLTRALGSARFLAGEGNAIELLRQAFDATQRPRERASIAAELASLLALFDQAPEAVELLTDAMERLEPTDPLMPSLQAAFAHVAEFDISTSDLLDRHGLDAEPPVGDTADERHLLATLSFRRVKQGDSLADAVALAERALRGGCLMAEQSTDILRAMYAIQTLVLSDRFDAAREPIELFFEHARARGSLMGFTGASWLRGNLSYRLGALEEAEADFREAVSASRLMGANVTVNAALLVEVLLQRGQIEAAQRELASALDDRFDIDNTTNVFALFGLHSRALVHIATGELQAGVDDLLELGRRCERWGDRNPSHFAWRSEAALAMLQLQQVTEAKRLAAEEVCLARRFGAPRAIAIAVSAQALVEGRSAEIELLQEATTTIHASPARLSKAQVLVELGAALRRANRRAEARTPLTEGLKLAEACRADPLAKRARDELRAAGARARAVVRTGVTALTPSERRVCELAAAGMSNPEIAQALFVTRATVESHLHASYRKLDVSSRHKLAKALGSPANPVGTAQVASPTP